MGIINQVMAEQANKLSALSHTEKLDGTRMIKRLCKHFSHKINAGWNDNHGYIEFAMGFCDMSGDNSKLNLRCSANSKAELIEIIDCINNHFLRFDKRTTQAQHPSLQWSMTNQHD